MKKLVIKLCKCSSIKKRLHAESFTTITVLVFLVFFNACSEDDFLGDNEYLGGEVQAKRYVSKIVKEYVHSSGKVENEFSWTFEYDNQNRIVQITESSPYYSVDYYNFTYEENKIIQTKKTEGLESWKVWEIYLNENGYAEKMTRHNEPRSSYDWDTPENDDVEFFTYDENGFLISIDCSRYDGEDKRTYWENGDMVRIIYNESGPVVNWKYGEIINNASINIDFNYILNENELSEWFIESKMFKALDCFGKRTKHYKTEEYGYSTPEDGSSYEGFVYTYKLDEDGYVTQIIEQSKGYEYMGDDEYDMRDSYYTYTISYVK